MQRAPIVLVATAGGLAATLGFNAHRPATTLATTKAASPSSSPSTTSNTSRTSTSSSSAKTVTSDAVDTQYGPVQLRVTIAKRRITKVEALELPTSDPKSAEISSYAEPLLRQSALSKQSASIDAVSGATYTSGGYQTALQSALDKAGFRSPGSTS